MESLVGDQYFKIDNVKICSSSAELFLDRSLESFIIVASGNCALSWSNKGVDKLKKGIFYLPSGQSDKINIHTDEDVHIYVMSLNKDLAVHYFFSIYPFTPTDIIVSFEKEKCFDNIVQIVEMLWYESQNSPLDMVIVKSLIQSYLSIFYKEFIRIESLLHPEKTNYHIPKLLTLIDENYKINHPLLFYANALVLSERQLNNIIKKHFNTNLSTLLTKRKVVEAQKALIETKMTVTEIGFDLGYTEKSYFSRVFKKHTNKTPTEYQNEQDRRAK